MLSYADTCVLYCLDIWPDQGLPLFDLPQHVLNIIEGDPKGDVTVAECELSIERLVADRLVVLLPAGFVRITPAGLEVYEKQTGLASRRRQKT